MFLIWNQVQLESSFLHEKTIWSSFTLVIVSYTPKVWSMKHMMHIPALRFSNLTRTLAQTSCTNANLSVQSLVVNLRALIPMGNIDGEWPDRISWAGSYCLLPCSSAYYNMEQWTKNIPNERHCYGTIRQMWGTERCPYLIRKRYPGRGYHGSLLGSRNATLPGNWH